MSGARWLRQRTHLTMSLLGSLFGWAIIAPAAALVPRRRDWVAVVGRQHGMFVDNTKYFFAQASAHAPHLRVVFITEHANVVALLAPRGREVLRYPGWRAIWYLVRCGTAVVDSMDWSRHGRRFLLVRARLLQLWHGVGFKRIERDRWLHEVGRARRFSSPWIVSLRIALYRATGRFVRYDAVNTTSRFYRDEVFIPALLARQFWVAGYPRNTFGAAACDDEQLSWSNVDAGIAECLGAWSQAGRRLVVVAPTMRDTRDTPVQLDETSIRSIDAFAEAQNAEFVFKFHPSETGTSRIVGRHVHLCLPSSDLYPILGRAAALVTDYSSIYMDYLLLDRPIVFLIPDGNRYVREDREVQFDLTDMMPGPVVETWDALLAALERQWRMDDFAQKRARLRAKAFDELPQAQATAKLLDFMREGGWLP